MTCLNTELALPQKEQLEENQRVECGDGQSGETREWGHA